MQDSPNLLVFSGNANKALAQSICKELGVQPGKALPWCVEQLLVCGGFSAVLAWPGEGMDTRSLRRLQVAAEGQAVFALLWRSTGAASLPGSHRRRRLPAADP